MFNKKKIAAITACAVFLSLVPCKNAYATGLIRLSGSDRYKTAVEISKTGWTNSEYVIIACGENFPDALSAAPLSKKYNAPILLTEGNRLTEDTKAQIIKLKASKAIIMGGYSVVGTSVEQELENLNLKVTRVAGMDRYETSVKAAEQMGNVDKLIIATGDDYCDALSAAPAAAINNIPILLVHKNILSDSIKDYIKNKNIKKTYVVGDSSIISDNVVQNFENVERIEGRDKYARNLAVIDKFSNNFTAAYSYTYVTYYNYRNIYLATGDNFADALSGISLAIKNASPMILFNPYDVEGLNKIINTRKVGTAYVLGGEAAIDTYTLNSILEGGTKERVEFKDSAFEECIRRALGITTSRDIYSDEVLNITHLNANGRGIKNIEGIEKLSNLKTLDISSNDILDFSPLRKLNNLKSLTCTFNRVNNLSFLSNVTSLETLDLSNNNIEDITPLQNLRSLKELKVNHNLIMDMGKIRDLKDLTGLEAYSNYIMDLRPLQNLTNLKKLLLSDNFIFNYSPISAIYPNLNAKDFDIEDSINVTIDIWLDNTVQEQLRVFENRYNYTFDPYKVIYHSYNDLEYDSKLSSLKTMEENLKNSSVGQSPLNIRFLNETLDNITNAYGALEKKHVMNESIKDLENTVLMTRDSKEKMRLRNKINYMYSDYRYEYYKNELYKLDNNIEDLREEDGTSFYSQAQLRKKIQDEINFKQKQKEVFQKKYEMYERYREFFCFVDNLIEAGL